MHENGILRSSLGISRYHDPIIYFDHIILVDIAALTIDIGTDTVPDDIPVDLVDQAILVHIIERDCDNRNVPHYAHAAVPIRTHTGHVILPRDIPGTRPCLGIVILVDPVEVPGAADLLVCGHAELGGGVYRVTGGRVIRGE